MTKKMKIGLGVGAGVIAVTALGLGLGFGLSGGGGTTDIYGKYYVTPGGVGDPASMPPAYRVAKTRGAELIIGAGFPHASGMALAVKGDAAFYDDVGFISHDEQVNTYEVDKDGNLILDGDGNPIPVEAAFQMASFTYRADLGSIETGIAAAYFLNSNQAAFIGADKSGNELSYSMWGGLAIPAVTSFMGGFQAGVNWANTELAGKPITQKDGTTKTYVEVKQTFGTEASEFTGGFNPENGKKVQESIINQEADLIMPVAGPQFQTAQELIIDLNSKSLLIGVDSAIESGPNTEKIANQELQTALGDQLDTIVAFSSLKNLGKMTNLALNLINNGNTLPEGVDPATSDYSEMIVEKADGTWVGGFGVSGVGNYKNGMVGVSGIGVDLAKEAVELAGATTDPWLDAKWDLPANMVYTGKGGTRHWYGATDGTGAAVTGALHLEPSLSIPVDVVGEGEDPDPWSRYDEVLIKKDMIRQGVAEDDNKIKIVLSSEGSILLDGSFSQSCYLGLAAFMDSKDIVIPLPAGFKPGEGI